MSHSMMKEIGKKKSYFILIAGVLSFSDVSSAAGVRKNCFSTAESAVKQQSSSSKYDVDGFNAYQCSVSADNTQVLCEVSASKGDGEATDTFRVVLKKSCSKVLMVEMIGEE